MELQGTYAPPRMGRTSVPIPLVGPGKFALTDAGLEVSGYKRGGGGGLAIAGFVLGSIFLIAIGAAKFGPPPKWAVYLIAGVIVSGIMYLSNKNRGKAGSNAKPWAFTVPWTSVTKAYEDTEVPGGICVAIKKFKPSGTLHFQPDGQVSMLQLITEISRRANK